MRNGCFLRVAASLLMLTEAATASAGSVTALSLRRAEAGNELTVEVSGATHPRLFTLERPARVVLDLSAATLAPGARAPKVTPGVMAVRVGRHDEDVVRIVLEVPRPVRPSLVTERSGGQTTYRVQFAGAEANTPSAVAVRVGAGHGGDDQRP
jgi:AMIN domain